MSETVTGEVTFVKKEYGGITINGDMDTWYNAANDDLKAEVAKLTKGDQIKFTYSEIHGKNKISEIENLSVDNNKPMNVKQEVVRDTPTTSTTDRVRDIRMQNLLKSAGYCFQGRDMQPKDVAKWCKSLYKEIYAEEW